MSQTGADLIWCAILESGHIGRTKVSESMQPYSPTALRRVSLTRRNMEIVRQEHGLYVEHHALDSYADVVESTDINQMVPYRRHFGLSLNICVQTLSCPINKPKTQNTTTARIFQPPTALNQIGYAVTQESSGDSLMHYRQATIFL